MAAVSQGDLQAGWALPGWTSVLVQQCVELDAAWAAADWAATVIWRREPLGTVWYTACWVSRWVGWNPACIPLSDGTGSADTQSWTGYAGRKESKITKGDKP